MKVSKQVFFFVVIFVFPAFGHVPGNINQDGIIDISDLILLSQHWLDPNEIIPENIDRSGPVDIADFTILSRYWLVSQEPDHNEMTFIPGGIFQMGDSHSEGYVYELPVHTVMLDSFYMGKYEVTNEQFCQFLNSALSQGLITVNSGIVYKAGTIYPYCRLYRYDSDSQIDYTTGTFSVCTKNGRNMAYDPMVAVSWFGAVAFCNWRSQQEGYETCYDLLTWNCDFSKTGYRLPTEAEWEYAARGGLADKRFPWGYLIGHKRANYRSDASYSYDVSSTPGLHPDWNDAIFPCTSPVGSFPANCFGLYDMAGNVYDWCHDWYASDYYTYSPVNNPTGPASSSSGCRIARGGSWDAWAFNCRTANRHFSNPSSTARNVGIRIVLR